MASFREMLSISAFVTKCSVQSVSRLLSCLNYARDRAASVVVQAQVTTWNLVPSVLDRTMIMQPPSMLSEWLSQNLPWP